MVQQFNESLQTEIAPINPDPTLENEFASEIDEDPREDITPETQEEPQEDEVKDTSIELNELREKVRELNERLLAQAEESKRISEQLGEFFDVFPNADIKTLPDSVWDSVRAGNSLAASYALYRQRVYQRELAAKAVNERNTENSSGRVGRSNSKEYFSPDEVRSMSRSEVKANYSKIIESMKKWN